MGRKASNERAPLPAMPEIEAGELAGQAWLLAMDKLARGGDDRAAEALRSSRTARPDWWDRHRENPADQAIAAWLALWGDDGPASAYVRTAMRHDAERLREELLQGSSDALDRVMVDRIVAAHLAVNYYDAIQGQAMKNGAGMRTLDHYAARAAAANRTFLRACETLAKVRRLRGPSVAVNVGTVNVGAVPASSAPAALPVPEPAGEAIEAAFRDAAPAAAAPRG